VVELDHENAYHLLVATILAAQSTDKLINTVTPALFARYPDPAALARAEPAELEPMIFSTGFYRNKAKSLIGMARGLVENHGGEVPSTMAELVELPGVARKTANVVLGSALGKNEGVVVDTHVGRLAPRLGLTTETDPVKIEADLMRIIPRDQWSIFAHRLIWHGRRVCFAKQPDCEHCTLAPLCPSAGLGSQPASPASDKSNRRRLGAEAAKAKVAGAAAGPASARHAGAAAARPAASKLPVPASTSAARPAASKRSKPAGSSRGRSAAPAKPAAPTTGRARAALAIASRSGKPSREKRA
jgi:endonuclease-3